MESDNHDDLPYQNHRDTNFEHPATTKDFCKHHHPLINTITSFCSELATVIARTSHSPLNNSTVMIRSGKPYFLYHIFITQPKFNHNLKKNFLWRIHYCRFNDSSSCRNNSIIGSSHWFNSPDTVYHQNKQDFVFEDGGPSHAPE